MKSKMAAYHCCVPLCVSDSRKEELEISFHSFPSKPKRRAEWIVKIRRDPGDRFSRFVYNNLIFISAVGVLRSQSTQRLTCNKYCAW